MTPSDRIELALRAGQLAKTALGLTECSGPRLAKLHLLELTKLIQETHEFLKTIATTGTAQV